MKASEQKVEAAMKWFESATDRQRASAIRSLVEFAISAEWINMWSEEDQVELSNESGRSIEEYKAPYFTTCGEPIYR